MSLAGLLLASTAAHAGSSPLFGVNFSALEAGSGNKAYFNYPVPTLPNASILSATTNVVRIPFIFSRLQPNGSGTAFDPVYLGYIQTIVQQALALNIVPIVDDHDYGSYQGNDITTSTTTGAQWAQAEATLAADLTGPAYTGVAFDLMNEPESPPNSALVAPYNMAISAIRSAGFTGTLFVEPTTFAHASQITGASWSGLAGISDPDGNIDLDVHNYMDPYQNGEGGDPSNANVGVQQLQGVVAFLGTHPGQPFNKALVGETGVAQTNGVVDAISARALTNELTYIRNNPAAFYGVTLWSAGPFFGQAYPLDVNPQAGGAQQQTMTIGQNIFFPFSVYLAADSYNGDPAYSIKLDGVTVAAGTVPNNRLTSAPMAVGVPNSGVTGSHSVTVTFLNDAYAGTPTTDRNLFLMGSSFAGASLGGTPQPMVSSGNTATVTFTAP